MELKRSTGLCVFLINVNTLVFGLSFTKYSSELNDDFLWILALECDILNSLGRHIIGICNFTFSFYKQMMN